MPLSTGAKIALGLAAAGGVAYAVSRRRSPPAPSRSPFPEGTPASVILEADPLCAKYPDGSWASEYGYPYLKGNPLQKPGWTKEETARVVGLANAAVEASPGFESMAQAKELTFALTRQVVGQLCPGLELPVSRQTTENYLKKSLGLRWLWQSVEGLVWPKLVGLGT